MVKGYVGECLFTNYETQVPRAWIKRKEASYTIYVDAVRYAKQVIYLFIFTFYSLLLQILEVLDNQSLYQDSFFFFSFFQCYTVIILLMSTIWLVPKHRVLCDD